MKNGQTFGRTAVSTENMTTSSPTPDNLPRLTRDLWLILVMFIALIISFGVYVYSEKQIDHANEQQQQSDLLADELNQSSDDLTRMVRTYVVTGNPIYKKYFQNILDIRNGKAPRPLDYSNNYWDLILAGKPTPKAMGPAIDLLELMRRAGFTQTEFTKLAEAKTNSDKLTQTERAAMALIEEGPPVSAANRDQAIAMLHDDAYHQAKGSIMLPLREFRRMSDQRTAQAVADSKTNAMRMRLVLISLGLCLLWQIWRTRQNLYHVLGAPMQTLHNRIMRLGSGDFSAPIPVPAGMENSVIGWLSETQIKLARIDAQHQDAETKNRRLTRFYAALSQSNQAIARCTDENELFIQLCNVVVTFGGMQMAWIGVLDNGGPRIKAVASYGNGIDYLDDLNISVDEADPHGRGPTGTAFRENRPFWCQDFQANAATALWHARGLQFGWKASGSLPLHRDGEVVAVFTMYANETNVFDTEEKNLLLEMALDIDFALTSLSRKTQKNLAEAALRASEQHLRTIIETEPECIKVVDEEGRLLQMNAAGLAMLEADSLAEAQRQKLSNYILPAYRKAFSALHQRVMAGESGHLTFEIVGLKGTQRWLETHAAPMHDKDHNVTMLLGITRDITQQKQAESRIQYLAQFDSLTGLPNRTQLEDRAKYLISLAQRSQTPIALMFLDLDHFKDINDTLGHSIGDALLVELSQRLRRVLREEDTLARLGGDEFIFLLHNVDSSAATLIAQKLLTVISAPYQIESYDLNVSGSIGITLYPDDGADLETLFKRADAAMYRAKQEGRNGFCFFTAEMQTHSARHLELINALRYALERKQLQVHYQPQISMLDHKIIGAEALLRWNHPELGAISPAEFIPAAEDCGLILPIGEWVLRQAVRQAKSWIDQGFAPLVMAVNLSAVQFRQPDLPDLVSRILEEEGLPPEYLELELTEGVTMNDPQAAIAIMNNLHDRGIRMSIDDFGTGYSSLNHLKKFKVYKLKIDQSFVRDICTDPEDKAIVGAVIHMAQNLGLLTIAEGVETAGQLAFLREHGCDEIQGFFYSKPLSAENFEAFARSLTANTNNTA